jgi:CBS domain-containing protein
MKAVDICRKPVVTAAAATSIVEIAALMRANHVGSVVVVANNGGRKPVGIVTDRDIVVEVLALGLDATTMTAGDIMSQSPAVSGEDDDVLWALKTMRDRGVRRLPVVDGKGEIAGMLAFDDVVQHLGTSIGDIAQMIGTQRLVETTRRA